MRNVLSFKVDSNIGWLRYVRKLIHNKATVTVGMDDYSIGKKKTEIPMKKTQRKKGVDIFCRCRVNCRLVVVGPSTGKSAGAIVRSLISLFISVVVYFIFLFLSARNK